MNDHWNETYSTRAIAVMLAQQEHSDWFHMASDAKEATIARLENQVRQMSHESRERLLKRYQEVHA